MKKLIFVAMGLCFVNHIFAADGAAKSLSREELELLLLAAQVEKAQAEAREAVARAEIVESAAASKKTSSTSSGITAAAARVPGVTFVHSIKYAPSEPDPMALSEALVRGAGLWKQY